MNKVQVKVKKTLRKDELIHLIAARSGQTLKQTESVIDAFAEVVKEGVAQGHEVRLYGFGTWSLRWMAERRVKALHTPGVITLPAHKRVAFSVGAVLAQAAKE
jgi:nucleoid DNA-binding protein